jgi:hypothetical protein
MSIPFADELLLGLGAALLANWRKPDRGNPRYASRPMRSGPV